MGRIDDEFLSMLSPPPDVDPRDLLGDLLGEVMSRAPRGPAAPRTEVDAARLLSLMPEMSRQALMRDFVSARSIPIVSALWLLGDQFAKVGRYRLATAFFAHAALGESPPPLMRATLFVKAGAAQNNGGGRHVEGWLANALGLLSGSEANSGTSSASSTSGFHIRLIRCFALYQLSILEMFRDASDAADGYRRQAISQLKPQDLELLDLSVQSAEKTADFLTLQARIERGRIDAASSGNARLILKLLDDAELQHANRLFIGSPVGHYLAYQRAAVYLLDGQLANAREFALNALHGLPHFDPEETLEHVYRPPTTLVNTRRRGYIENLMGEIEFEERDYELAVRRFTRSVEIWSAPQYTRGISRAVRNRALCLLELGGRWSEASRQLAEAAAFARAVRNHGAEARALAGKVALHTRLGHGAKAAEYENQIRAISYSYSDISSALNRIRAGHAVPITARSIDSEFQRSVKDAGLLGTSVSFDRALVDTRNAANSGSPILLVSERGCEVSAFAQLVHAMRGGGKFESRWANTLSTPRKPRGRPRVNALESPAVQQARPSTVLVQGVAMDENQLTSVERAVLGVLSAEGGVGVRDTTLIVGIEADGPQWTRVSQVVRSALRGNLVIVKIPPLRERGADVVLLGGLFLSQAIANHPSLSIRVRSLSTEAWRYLSTYSWPGNLDQLRAVMHSIAMRLFLAPPEDLAADRIVNDAGEVLLEFVAPCVAYLWTETNGEILTPSVPITPEALRQLARRRVFRSTTELGRYLAMTYDYQGNIASLVRMLYRREPFKNVLPEVVQSTAISPRA
jgi:tetratricopeptide (TPR) repeat protein